MKKNNNVNVTSSSVLTRRELYSVTLSTRLRNKNVLSLKLTVQNSIKAEIFKALLLVGTLEHQ